MEQRHGKAILIILVCLLSLLSAVLAVGFLKIRAGNRELNDRIAQLEEELSEPVDIEELMASSEGVELSNGEIYYSRETIKQKARDAVSLTELMSMIFSDKAVYYDGEKYIYAPLSDKLNRHDYDLDRIVTDKKSDLKGYTDGKGRVGLKGIDVSTWQGDIDWAAVKNDGVKFAFLRAGYRGYESGNIYEDDTLINNLSGANENGIPVGVYFYSQAATPAEAVEEAEYILQLIAGYDVSWPIVFDMELEESASSRTRDLTPERRTDIAIAFCDRISDAGYTPMIYGNMRMLCGEMQPERLGKYEKWLAQYFYKPRYPYEFGIWQYTSEGHIDGIDGNVDINLAFRDYGR